MVKGGMREQFGELRKIGIKSIMITGDNPMTAAAIAAEAGVMILSLKLHPRRNFNAFAKSNKKGY